MWLHVQSINGIKKKSATETSHKVVTQTMSTNFMAGSYHVFNWTCGQYPASGTHGNLLRHLYAPEAGRSFDWLGLPARWGAPRASKARSTNLWMGFPAMEMFWCGPPTGSPDQLIGSQPHEFKVYSSTWKPCSLLVAVRGTWDLALHLNWQYVRMESNMHSRKNNSWDAISGHTMSFL